MLRSYFSLRQTLVGAALLACILGPTAAQAMGGANGADGQDQSNSFTYSEPTQVIQGGNGADNFASDGYGGSGGNGLVLNGANATDIINAGSFLGGNGGSGTISGGSGGSAVTFGLTATGSSTVTGIVNGGSFVVGQPGIGSVGTGGAGLDFNVVSGTVTINGQFTSVNGSAVNYAANSSHSIGGNTAGSFTALLADNTASQTYTYSNAGILTFQEDGTASPSAAPEPSQVAGLSFIVLGLGGLILKARRKQAA